MNIKDCGALAPHDGHRWREAQWVWVDPRHWWWCEGRTLPHGASSQEGDAPDEDS